MADSDWEAISESGIGVSTGFVGAGFAVAREDCWAAAVLPLKTQQNVINKTIRMTRRRRNFCHSRPLPIYFWRAQASSLAQDERVQSSAGPLARDWTSEAKRSD